MNASFKAESAYLINVAEAIQQYLLPEVSGQAHARAMDCINIVLRVAATLGGEAVAAEVLAPSAEQEAQCWAANHARFEQLLSGVTQTQPQSKPELAADAVQSFLRSHSLGGAQLQVTEAKLLAGGRSKLTATVKQEGAAQLPSDLVLRKDWFALSGSSVRSEFGLLQRLWAHGVKVPEPLILEPGNEALGAPFIVVARVSGWPHGNILTPPDDEALVLCAAEALAQVHKLSHETFDALPGIAERNFTADQLSATLAGFDGIFKQLQEPRSVLLGDAVEWLQRNIHRVKGHKTLVHGDFGFHNLLFDGKSLSAILDWELAHLGNPAYDLGYLRAVVEQRVDWADFMRQYHAAGGPAVDAFAVDWFSLFASLWLYSLLLQARAGVVARALHDIEIVSVCAHIGPPLLHQIATLLRRVSPKEQPCQTVSHFS